ncbi:MAG: hypothetical protein E7240_01905 [Lachnospiraceae bacterium]|nr:hypothetical protein [Lachnospiraceae bacterium]
MFKIMSAQEAVRLIDDNAVIGVNSFAAISNPENLHDALTTFLREENFRCGLSVAGGSLLKMHALYLQAKFALEQGARLNPSVWLYRFRDYRMQYLKQKISEDFSPEEFLVPGLSLLAQYDEENNTDYMNTLRVYLMEDRNISQAAQKLSMHRSTLMYRLKKIREITGENPDLAEVKVLLAFLMI